ncbi:hypothetical protein H0H92_003029 [Tricholoma furcatifolium]|nr:hypothetical protein H0H92_003029 [Tricholoma furcatifolium]
MKKKAFYSAAKQKRERNTYQESCEFRPLPQSEELADTSVLSHKSLRRSTHTRIPAGTIKLGDTSDTTIESEYISPSSTVTQTSSLTNKPSSTIAPVPPPTAPARRSQASSISFSGQSRFFELELSPIFETPAPAPGLAAISKTELLSCRFAMDEDLMARSKESLWLKKPGDSSASGSASDIPAVVLTAPTPDPSNPNQSADARQASPMQADDQEVPARRYLQSGLGFMGVLRPESEEADSNHKYSLSPPSRTRARLLISRAKNVFARHADNSDRQTVLPRLTTLETLHDECSDDGAWISLVLVQQRGRGVLAGGLGARLELKLELEDQDQDQDQDQAQARVWLWDALHDMVYVKRAPGARICKVVMTETVQLTGYDKEIR